MSTVPKATPKVFTIVGNSGSGKTTLVEKLIRELSSRGLRVATIKYANHKVVLDTPGKDSYRNKEAGAVMSMLVTSSQMQLVSDLAEEREPGQLAERFMGGADLVLAEGFSLSPGAKIEVVRRECGKPPRCTLEDGLIAVVTDMEEVFPKLPHFALDDIDGIVEFILQRAA
ncbi:MAG: molybdopterin-guanine dinucleotide biosynthesis protein B [Nitrosomonadales bacterium]|nr:molybdopterin-guanine dinucleotide biosynthesis protein B [Nitrosomonadales bacterium]